ncbi:PLP-dependent aminotransferase family protein [Rhabdaerophilum sp.]|uniref:MocR-like pyridoxine biosynthesis transcription factor PdxR n=1 Tax=Rhabdaerophilum sp. TaxID=2717341 RepID=UPI0038D3E4CF
MPKRRITVIVPSLKALDRSRGNLGRQLAQHLREAIVSGELKPGERLPSTRTLAVSLGLARGTVAQAFDQLAAEGYLDARVGAGTRVTADLQAGSMFAPVSPGRPATLEEPLPAAAVRLAGLVQSLVPQPPIPFAVAIPAAGIEPDDTWRRVGNRVRASGRAAPSTYADPHGLLELRTAIATHVRRARAVHCSPDNVIVTSGTQQGLSMAARVLLSRGETVWAEDPTYPGLTAVLDDLDLQTHRVPVDEQGFDVGAAWAASPDARAAFVTPSHQYPVGMPLSMSRRQALVGWAQQNRTWIVEDDYDSELRYAGHPFPAIQGLSPSRVIYLGTFSKVLFPSLRLGYVIAPSQLVDAFAGARAILDRHSPLTDQHLLAAYMNDGFFEAHVRRIRGLYAERRAVLLAALSQGLPDGCEIQPSDQGMHILLWLPSGADDVRLAKLARNMEIAVRPISPMYAEPPGRPGLMLGFGGFRPERLVEASGHLLSLLASHNPWIEK